jgi:hypothetical protein
VGWGHSINGNKPGSAVHSAAWPLVLCWPCCCCEMPSANVVAATPVSAAAGSLLARGSCTAAH